MSKKKKDVARSIKTRAEPEKFLCTMDAYETLCCSGYTRLSQNPEIQAAVGKIADLISSMTIHLMSNTDKGDVRIRNELSKKVDITPNKWMTRKTFISAVVRNLLLEGDGNAVVYPETQNGLLMNMIPLRMGAVSYLEDGYGYLIGYEGKYLNPDNLLHFVINPDPDYPWKGTGYKTTLKDVAHNLKQAAATEKGFMESKWKPSIIVKVDGLTEEFASKEGRGKLLKQYIETSEAGEPWMIPADQFEVQEVRPLSLQDIALSESVTLDKKTVAAILGVPAFVVGAGEFDKDEWNNFIKTRIGTICNAIEQELTRKLLLSPDWYFRFNVRSLYAYDIKELAQVGDDQYIRGIMTGNEVRDWIGLSPMEGLDDLIILENYIPRGMIGDQKKLDKGGED
ncbi:phage portal protein [Murimonas intestini]|uniref:HK97 family phage portal protein n=1 Tax=Murimonas intestini TaxID=1337051 RepID=A0AB73SZM5_9FIRM|nr:phage portal protein [Murimonas intestini]MCR1842763.1 phage portal protein [Murimonas intestini]MCR1867898.1 phage portal protein [Murimonas intestini]MCR1885250.1 phage portal protein [Murimonas intestini]